ncbi:hypothetical protein GQ55_2G220200 [Panicum hallii var. hallii]|uniref:Uncharacterized protein n=1 Tax=Panicum hallii var. hallii TaxID=1504633 RepID=A0A2T7ER69_9POAL|nr:hypothetical protein GQ55_2G220200 [Panicum hallii var. hallii]
MGIRSSSRSWSCYIETYIREHHGADPTQPELLCSENVTQTLMRYGDEMVARHGEEYDWRRSDVDVGALYSSGGGKKHGRFSMLNGVIDTGGALSQARSSRSSQSSQAYERESQLQEQMRRQQEALQRQEEWAKQQHDYMQGFFAQQRQIQEMLAATLGSQFNLPPLPSPPPPPPTFVPYPHDPSPQVGSTSSHSRGVSGSPSTLPLAAARNTSGGDCGSGYNFTP